jgi:hypothetical protein
VSRGIALLVIAAACSEPPAPSALERERAALIRDSAAEMGLHNAALLGGIAISETNLAHCWSEAQYACMGPPSPSCGGEPIIAGSADGPCADEQGGLGMFQFDAGTYADTLAMYGDSILTIEGNSAQAVAFVVDKVKLEVDGVADWMAAVGWMDTVPMRAGDPLMEQWSHLIACRYNGCCATSAVCEERADGYRDHAIEIFGDLGAEFWDTASRCVLPDDGIVAPRSACYVAAGEPRFWRRTNNGETTMSTTGEAPANLVRWLLEPARAATYTIEVHVPAGVGNALAVYRVVQPTRTTEVTIDQTTADGFVVLGDFELAGGDYVELGDNTGVAGQTIVFDQLRVRPTEDLPP